MTFEECYTYIERLFYSHDFSDIGQDFSMSVCLQGKNGGYVYLLWQDGMRFSEPVRHKTASIYLTMTMGVFEKLRTGQLEIFKAFTTKQILAKGNVVLAMSIYNSFK